MMSKTPSPGNVREVGEGRGEVKGQESKHVTESRKRMIPKEWKELRGCLKGNEKHQDTDGGERQGCPDGRSDLRQGAEEGINKLHSGNNNQGLWECKRSPRGVRGEGERMAGEPGLGQVERARSARWRVIQGGKKKKKSSGRITQEGGG